MSLLPFCLCNGCHGLTTLHFNIRDIAVITAKDVDYGCIIHGVSKPEAIHLLEKSLLEDCEYI